MKGDQIEKEEYLTVKEAAELLRVSRQAVYSKYKDKFIIKDGVKVIDKDMLNSIQASPERSDAETVEILTKQLDTLTKQLDKKDEQIEALTRQLDSLTKTLDSFTDIYKAGQVLQLTAQQQQAAEILREPEKVTESQSESRGEPTKGGLFERLKKRLKQ